MSYSKDEELLKKILNNIIHSTAGIKNAIIIDDTGITIMSRSKFATGDDVSVEKIGAIGGAVFTAGEEQGFLLGYGEIRLQITEYKQGMLFSVAVGNGTLCLATDNNVQIGYIRAVLKKWAPKIAVILARYLKTDQEAMNKELKELFNSDTMGLL